MCLPIVELLLIEPIQVLKPLFEGGVSCPRTVLTTIVFRVSPEGVGSGGSVGFHVDLPRTPYCRFVCRGLRCNQPNPRVETMDDLVTGTRSMDTRDGIKEGDILPLVLLGGTIPHRS